jgi:hypothetical protein
MRKTLTLLCLLAGIGLASVSFFMAIPADPFASSPKIPFASVFFIAGVMLAFLSAVVYELTPGKRAPRTGSANKARSLHH